MLSGKHLKQHPAMEYTKDMWTYGEQKQNEPCGSVCTLTGRRVDDAALGEPRYLPEPVVSSIRIQPQIAR